jgi:hypothetical protein
MDIRKVKRGEVAMAKLGQIKILAERKVKMVELDIDVDNKTLNKIAKIGLRMIKKDKQALFNYAFVEAIKRSIGK